MDRDFVAALLYLGHAYAAAHQFDASLATFERVAAISVDAHRAKFGIGYALARSGRTAESERVIDDLRDLSRTRYVPPIDLAYVFTALGRHETALEYLERALDDRSFWVPFLGVEPMVDDLRDHDRFRAAIAQIGVASALA